MGTPFQALPADTPVPSAGMGDSLVSLEGIKALVGHHPSLGPGLTAQSSATPQEELMGTRMCIRAWSMVVAQVGATAKFSWSGMLAGCKGSRQQVQLPRVLLWEAHVPHHVSYVAATLAGTSALPWPGKELQSGSCKWGYPVRGCRLHPKTASNQPPAHHRCTSLSAWQSLASKIMQASTEVVYVPGAQSEEAGSLAGAIGARIREGLASTSAALVCGAARAAGSTYLRCHCCFALRSEGCVQHATCT